MATATPRPRRDGLTDLFGVPRVDEPPRFRALAPVMRVGLFSLRITSYFAYLPRAGRLVLALLVW